MRFRAMNHPNYGPRECFHPFSDTCNLQLVHATLSVITASNKQAQVATYTKFHSSKMCTYENINIPTCAFVALNHSNYGQDRDFINFQTLVIYNWYMQHSLWLQLWIQQAQVATYTKFIYSLFTASSMFLCALHFGYQICAYFFPFYFSNDVCIKESWKWKGKHTINTRKKVIVFRRKHAEYISYVYVVNQILESVSDLFIYEINIKKGACLLPTALVCVRISSCSEICSLKQITYCCFSIDKIKQQPHNERDSTIQRTRIVVQVI